jgi:CubicO group peptidase (beta-lactamase class C family)
LYEVDLISLVVFNRWETYMPNDQYLRSDSPEAQGLPSSAIRAFVEAAEQTVDALHSFMLLRHGYVVAEGWWSPYEAGRPHMLFSLSKSFASTGVGLAVAEGRLSVDDTVLSFFPDDAPEQVSQNLAAMRVRDLLSMSTGHSQDTTGPMREQPEGNWVRAFLAQPVEHAPGTHFLYNSGATYMLSAIVQRLTGTTLLEYLRPRLLAPLGINDATWESCPRGINVGGWGMSIKTADIARFGQLYLQNGMWQGERILPESWVAAASARQSDNSSQTEVDWRQGYGYQFWRCRHGAYRGDGAFGQFCVVMPEQDAVLAITAGVGNMQAVLNLAWEHLLPAMGPAPLPEDRPAQEQLRGKLAGLALPPQQGQASSPLAARVSGRTYNFEPNELDLELFRLDFDAERCLVTLRNDRGEHTFACGSGAWQAGTTDMIQPRSQGIAASGAWTSEDSYTIKLCFTQTPFCPTITCRFVRDEMMFDFRENVSFGPLEHPQLVGRSG